MIGHLGVVSPLIGTIESLNEPLGQKSLEVAHQDDIILAVEVNPAPVTLPGIPALGVTGLIAVENIIQRLIVDVAQLDVKILTQRHVPVAVYDQNCHVATGHKGRQNHNSPGSCGCCSVSALCSRSS